jgi:hypothetical protein
MSCMTMRDAKRALLLLLVLTALPPCAGAATEPEQEPGKAWLTVYHKDRATVHEVKTFRVHKGVNRLSLDEIPALLDPTSIFIRPLGAPADVFDIVEQNFRNPVRDENTYLFRHLGSKVRIRTRWDASLEGALLAGPFPCIDVSYGGRPDVRHDYRFLTLRPGAADRLIMLPREAVDRVEISAEDEAALMRPEFTWLANSGIEGPLDIELMYQTAGMSWQADYTLTVVHDSNQAHLQAQVTVENRSGRSFRNVHLKLVAGEVQLFRDEFGTVLCDVSHNTVHVTTSVM